MIPFPSVRVGPFDVEIIKLEGEERDKCLGLFSEAQMTIAMRESYRNSQQEAETLLHEIIHAIRAVTGIHPKDSEERMVSQMSIGMAMVIRDNPDLIVWLQEKLS